MRGWLWSWRGGPGRRLRRVCARCWRLPVWSMRSFGNGIRGRFWGGERQRVGLARAWATDPMVLLMDEPFGALDPLTRAEMQTMLRGLLKQMGKTVLLVTHDLDEALYLAQRVVFLSDGKIAADLSPEEIVGSD